MKKEYKMALSEVNTILQYSENEILFKIPQKFINFIQENMDTSYNFEIEKNKSLVEQNMMQETKQILALIYRDYLCSKEQKENLIEKEQKEADRIEKEKSEKYKIDFEKINKNRNTNMLNQTKNEWTLVKIQKEKWYKKLINKILKIFKIKNF